MKKTSKIIWLIFSFLVIVLGLTYFLYSRDVREEKIKISEATAADNVYGWAWGSNFGWVSLNCLNDFNGDEKITLPGENHCSSACYLGANHGDLCVDNADCPGGTCESRAYGVNIGPSGTFDDDSFAWSNNVGWFDFAPASTAATDPFGAATQDCTLNTDGTISGWARSVANLWGNPFCYSWVKMRGDQQVAADFELECVGGVDAGEDCTVGGDCDSGVCDESYTWNAGTSTFDGTYPYCVSCNYYNRYCSGGDNNGEPCAGDGDCPDGSCGSYVIAQSTESGAEYRCGVCYTDYDVLTTSAGAGALCVKTNNQTMCSGCTDNVDPDPDTCTSCPRCYEYGVAVDYSKNRLTGWGWGTLHKELGSGVCGTNLGVGWLAFHTSGKGVFAPWLESTYGGIYSAGGVGSSSSFRPPVGKYSATYAIHSGGTITNFYSASGSLWESQGYEVINFPDVSKNYSSILGKIDFSGLQSGLYGEVESIDGAGDIDAVLGGKVYVRNGNLTISNPITFLKGDSSTPSGSGTIIVRGDLNINANIAYSALAVDKLKYLPSVSFIVLGDINIDSSVSSLVGAYVALGDGDPVTCPELSVASSGCGRFNTGTSTSASLTVSGLVVAKQFNLQRLYMSLDEGSERFIYDGRLLANTPPGLQDITQALPEWNEIAP